MAHSLPESIVWQSRERDNVDQENDGRTGERIRKIRPHQRRAEEVGMCQIGGRVIHTHQSRPRKVSAREV